MHLSSLTVAVFVFTLLPARGEVTITQVIPSSAIAGSPDFTIALYGTGFVFGSTVLWPGFHLTTTFYNSSSLTIVVPAAATINAGQPALRVVNPDGASSNTIVFPIHPPTPRIALVSPLYALSGSPDVVLTISGFA